MVERSVSTRLSVKDAQRAARDMDTFGTRGQQALNRITAATGPTSRGLLAVDRGANLAQGGMRNLATSFAIFEGPLGAVSGRINALGAGLGRVNPLILALAGGIAVATGGFTKASTAGAAYERFLLRTEAQLIATRSASGLTSAELDRFSFSLAQNTLASTEGARRAASELLTFRAVAGDTFKETLALSQDLAASGIGSLESNALQLGKALQDPVRGLTALSRAGVQFTDQQKDQIAAMVEAGDRAAAQEVILDELRQQVGGAGAAEGGGLSGAFDTLTENLGRFFERVGEETGIVEGLTDSLRGLGDVVEDITPDNSIQARLAANAAEIEKITRAARSAGFEDRLDQNVGLQKELEIRRQLNAELGAEKRAREEAAIAADIAAKRASEQAQAEQERATAEKANRAAERAFNRERASALAELERLEEQAALAGLEGIEKLEVERDRALAEAEDRLRRRILQEEEAAKARLAIEEKFQKDKTQIEDRERERREKEEERARDKREREEERARDKRQREEEREAERAAERAARPFVNAAERIQQGFSDVFTRIIEDGEFKLSDLADNIKSIFARMLGELATLAILEPIVVPIVGQLASGLGLGGGAVSQITGNLGGGGAAGSPFGFGNLFGQVIRPADHVGTGSIFDPINHFGAQLGFAPSSGLGGLTPGAGPLNNIVSPGVFNGTTFSQFLGGAGLGFGAGALLNSFVGGNTTGGLIGSGVGGLAGAAIGSLIPGVGTVLGGLIGGAGGGFLGGLFGGDGKTVGPNSAAAFTVRDGELVIREANADNGGDPGQARAFGEQIASTVNQILESLGGSLRNRGIAGVTVGNGIGGFGVRFGPNFDTGARATFGQDSEAAGSAAVLGLFERAAFEGLDPALEAAVRRAAGISEDLEDFASNIAVAQSILSDDPLGIEELTAAERAISDLNDSFAEAAERAERLGLSVARLEEIRDDAIAELTIGFDEGIRRQILAFTDPLAAALEQLEEEQAARLREAEVLGADLVELERLNALERQRVIEEASAGALTSLERFRDEITFGSLSGVSPSQSVTGARAAFEAAAAQASAGSATALAEISSLGSGLLSLSRTAFASSAQFQQDLARVREVVENLLGDVPGFASGISSAPAGLAVLGERGPELVRFRGGEQVFSAAATGQILGAANGGGMMEIGREIARGNAEIVEELRAMRGELRELRRENAQLSRRLNRPRAA